MTSDDHMSTPKPSIRWSILFLANFPLGVILWVFSCTCYSWSNYWLSLAYPYAVAAVAIVSLVVARKKRVHRIYRLCYLPSLVASLPYVLLLVVFVVTLPCSIGVGLVRIGEESSRTRLAEAVSPDGSMVAEVDFLSLDYYGNEGRIEIRLKERTIPFIARSIHSFGYVNKSDWGSLIWQDDNVLHVYEKKLHAERELKIVIDSLTWWRVPFWPPSLDPWS